MNPIDASNTTSQAAVARSMADGGADAKRHEALVYREVGGGARRTHNRKVLKAA